MQSGVTRSHSRTQATFRPSRQSWNLEPCIVLVKKSARLIDVWILDRVTHPLATISLMKWNSVSICFVLSWWTVFLDNAIALWESQCILTLLCSNLIYVQIPLNQISSFTARVRAMYLTSVVERATTDCSPDFHDIVFPPSLKTILKLIFVFPNL